MGFRSMVQRLDKDRLCELLDEIEESLFEAVTETEFFTLRDERKIVEEEISKRS